MIITIMMISIKMYQLQSCYCKNAVEAVTSINAIQNHDVKQQVRMQTLKPAAYVDKNCNITEILQQK